MYYTSVERRRCVPFTITRILLSFLTRSPTSLVRSKDTTMPPKETDESSALVDGKKYTHLATQFSLDEENMVPEKSTSSFWKKLILVGVAGLAILLLFLLRLSAEYTPTGPYKLVELQEGKSFFDYYDFFDGPDSLGSAGYNIYVGKKRAQKLGLANITRDEPTGREYIFMQSASGEDGGFRESVRLEGKRRFDKGLFILDVEHMPSGCKSLLST